MQNANCKLQNEPLEDREVKMATDLSERLLEFAAAVIRLVLKLRTPVGRHVGGQLTRCSTSAGANYEEACGAERCSDFVHKLQVVLKELKESVYWLRLSQKAELISLSESGHLLTEARQLVKIIAKSVVTAKKNA